MHSAATDKNSKNENNPRKEKNKELSYKKNLLKQTYLNSSFLNETILSRFEDLMKKPLNLGKKIKFFKNLEINLLNDVLIEKFNLTTQKFDWERNNIKLPELSKESFCYVEISD